MQHFLKFTARIAWAWVVPPKLLDKVLLPADNAVASFDLRFAREALTPLADPFGAERSVGFSCSYA
jgi:hypothetical protein